MLVQAITAGVLAGSADLVAQKLAGGKKLQFKRASLLMVRTGMPRVSMLGTGRNVQYAHVECKLGFSTIFF